MVFNSILGAGALHLIPIMADVFLAAIVIYLLYRFLTGFVLPVYKTTQQVKQQFNQMKTPGQGPAGQAPPPPREAKPEPKPKASDYIDFEEIK